MQSQSQSEDPPTQTSTSTSTWPSILTTAKHTPRTSTPKPDLPSPEQQSLIDSLRISHLINPEHDSEQDQSELKSAIDDILAEYEDEDDSSTGEGDDKEQWQNLHAFLAFITKERIVPLEDVGIHVLRVALERGEHHYHHHHHHYHQGSGIDTGVPPGTATGTGRRKKMAVFVSCAAIWALVMGEELWERRGENEISQEEWPVGLSLSSRESDAHAPWEAAATVSKSRWQMWIDRFQFLSLAEDLDIKTRELAAEAAAVMRRVT